ncbi:MAG: glycoside hydrolase [Cyanobacteria bacterium SW_5_48_44]|nr:MAG: glycoside hydrolase [Cyanobacteria bacterium SW_5_48_44]
MKIAVIGAKGLPAGQGGIEHYCQQVYPRMVAQGHSVDLFARSTYTGGSWLSSYQFKGVRVICIPSLPLRGLDTLTNSAIAAIASLFRGYDIVHFHALGPALFCWFPRIASRCGVVVICQGLDWQRAKWGKLASSLIHLGEKAAAKYAHKVVVVSEYLRSYFRKTYGIDTTYIPNAPGEYAESDQEFPYVKSLGLTPGHYFLFLGRIVPEKRPDLLLKAFQSIHPEGWKLVIAGGVSDTSHYVSKLTEIASASKDVILTSEVRGSHLAEIVRGAGLFVLPSDLEGLPLAMLEAMQEGIPVLASDISPHRQLVGQERGLLFRAGDINSCARCLEQALKQPLELKAMAEKARDYALANYNWDRITSDNLAVYAQVTPSSAAKGDQASSPTQRDEEELIPKAEPQETLQHRVVTMTPEKNQRVQACLEEVATLVYEQIDQAELSKQEYPEQVLRQLMSEQFSLQVDLVLSGRRQEFNQVSSDS